MGRIRSHVWCTASVLALAAIPAGGVALAQEYAVVPGSAGNLVVFETPSGARPQCVVEVLSHAPWITVAAPASDPAGSVSLCFDVHAGAGAGTLGAIVLRLTPCANAGRPATGRHHAISLRVAPTAPGEQHDLRVDECCLPTSGIASPSPLGAPVLLGASPNPWCCRTNIRFGLPSDASALLRIFDVTGRRVRLISTAELDAGYHQIPWNGEDDASRPVPPGIYFYEIAAGPWSARGRVLRIDR